MPASDTRGVALKEHQIERNYAQMRTTQPVRFDDWLRRHEALDERDHTYHMPRISDIYSRVLINAAQREALHVTRKMMEALTLRSFQGSNGLVAEWVQVLKTAQATMYDEIREDPQTPGEQSLQDCMRLMRERSYDISEGVRFVRTPLALAALERKYYVEDLQRYAPQPQ